MTTTLMFEAATALTPQDRLSRHQSKSAGGATLPPNAGICAKRQLLGGVAGLALGRSLWLSGRGGGLKSLGSWVSGRDFRLGSLDGGLCLRWRRGGRGGGRRGPGRP